MRSLALALLIGCGGGSIVEDAEPVRVEPSGVWRELGAPIGDGIVSFSTDDFLTVNYETGTVAGLADGWLDALGEGGWVRDVDTSSDAMTSVSLTKVGEDDTLSLGVFEGIDGVTVTLTRFEPDA